MFPNSKMKPNQTKSTRKKVGTDKEAKIERKKRK